MENETNSIAKLNQSLSLEDAVELSRLSREYNLLSPVSSPDENDGELDYLYPKLPYSYEAYDALVTKAELLGFREQTQKLRDYHSLIIAAESGKAYVPLTPSSVAIYEAANDANWSLRLSCNEAWPHGCFARTEIETKNALDEELAAVPDSKTRPLHQLKYILFRGVNDAFGLIYKSCLDLSQEPIVDYSGFTRRAAGLYWVRRHLSMGGFMGTFLNDQFEPIPITPGIHLGPFVHNHSIGLAMKIIWDISGCVMSGRAGHYEETLEPMASNDPRIGRWQADALRHLRDELFPPVTDWPAWKVHRDSDILLNRITWELGQMLPKEERKGESLVDIAPNQTLCRVTVENGPRPSVVMSGEHYSVSGDMANFFEAMIEARGQTISATSFEIRSREIEALPQPLQQLIERSPGKGCRIPLENLWLC